MIARDIMHFVAEHEYALIMNQYAGLGFTLRYFDGDNEQWWVYNPPREMITFRSARFWIVPKTVMANGDAQKIMTRNYEINPDELDVLLEISGSEYVVEQFSESKYRATWSRHQRL